MKKLSLVLNVLLIVAVAILYYLHFSTKDNPGITVESAKPAIKGAKSQARVVYVNADSLFESYAYYDDIKKDLEVKRKNAEADLSARAKALESEFRNYEKNAGSMTNEQRQNAENVLSKKQQDFLKLREDVSQKYSNEEQTLHAQLYEKVGEYLKNQSRYSQYQYVFGYAKGGGILYASDSLDITAEIIEGLNSDYKKGGSKK
jgi:outer membrane protein